MKTSQKGFIAPILLALVAILLAGGAYAYLQKNQTNQPTATIPNSQATSTAQTSNSQTAGWKTYINSKRDFTLQYPATDRISYDGGESGIIQVVFSSTAAMFGPAYIAIFVETISGRNCHHALCNVPTISQISYNGIVWENIGPDEYCDIGPCAPSKNVVYRTTRGESRYYITFDAPDQAESVLKTFKFNP